MKLHIANQENCTGTFHTLHKKLLSGIKVFLMLFLFTGGLNQNAAAQGCNITDQNGLTAPLEVCANRVLQYRANTNLQNPTYTWSLTPGQNTSGASINSGINAQIVTINSGPNLVSNPAAYDLVVTISGINPITGNLENCVPNVLTQVDKVLVSASAPPIGCNASTSTITAVASGIGSVYSYTLNPGGTTNSTGIFSGVSPGDYTVTATANAPGVQACSAISNTVTINAGPPTPAAPTVEVVQPSCTVSTGQILVTSATAGMTFSINGGAYAAYPVGGYTVAAGSSNPLYQQNAAGCISPVELVQVNAQPQTPAAPTVEVVQPSCTVATGQIIVTSATAGMTFSINGGAYTAYPAGGYIVAAGSSNPLYQQSAAGCISPVQLVNVNAQPETPAVPTVTVTQPTCTVATGQIVVTSATAGMLFSINGSAYATYPVGGYTVAEGSSNPLYQQNAAGCISPDAPVIVNDQPATPLAPTLAVAQPTCTVATGKITVTSATAGMLFSLNGGAYAAYPVGGWSRPAGSANTVSQQNADGCNSLTALANVNAQPATPTAPVLDAVQPACPLPATGTVTLSSATAGMTFSVNGGAFAAYPAGGYTNLAPGEYCVRAQNAAGCISTASCITLATPICVFDGCSPGFWKNHEELWDNANDAVPVNMGALAFTVNTSFKSYFNLSAARMSEMGFAQNITMHGVISQGGGKCKSFGRHAVSALLTAGSGLNIDWPTGINNLGQFYTAIRNTFLAGNCQGAFPDQVAKISDDDHGNCGRVIPVLLPTRPNGLGGD